MCKAFAAKYPTHLPTTLHTLFRSLSDSVEDGGLGLLYGLLTRVVCLYLVELVDTGTAVSTCRSQFAACVSMYVSLNNCLQIGHVTCLPRSGLRLVDVLGLDGDSWSIISSVKSITLQEWENKQYGGREGKGFTVVALKNFVAVTQHQINKHTGYPTLVYPQLLGWIVLDSGVVIVEEVIMVEELSLNMMELRTAGHHLLLVLEQYPR